MSGIINNIKNNLHIIKKYVMQPERIIYNICNYDNYQFAKLFSDRLYLKCFYKKHIHKKLDLKNPKTFNEKLQWLKLYDRQVKYTTMADKIAAKTFISDLIGDEYVIPTIGVYDSVDEVPFDSLPEQFVIKCTHDSGSTFVCKNKNVFDIQSVKEELSIKLKRNFYWAGREWPYKNVKPMIIVEEFLKDEKNGYPLDYKLFCFNGKMQFFKVDYNRFTQHRANYFNRNFELQGFGEKWLLPDASIPLELPGQFEKMISLAERLAEGTYFLRVDFYYVNEKIYVGELTFYPAGGVGVLTNHGDELMGSFLELPQK